jgi:hypothetical protein
MVENLFIFGLVCYSSPGSQKINILTAQYKRISNAQAVYESEVFNQNEFYTECIFKYLGSALKNQAILINLEQQTFWGLIDMLITFHSTKVDKKLRYFFLIPNDKLTDRRMLL